MAILALTSGLIFIISQLLILNSMRRKSPFWIFFVTYEYFFIIGLGFYPIFLAFGETKINSVYTRYNDLNSFGSITFIHLITYSFGTLAGYFLFYKIKNNLSKYLLKCTNINISRSIFLCYALLISSTTATAFYILLVGVEKAFFTVY